MYANSCYPYTGYYPMQDHWSSDWRYYWHPQYYHWSNPAYSPQSAILLQDYGPKPLVINIARASKQNNNYRTTLWTGKYFQVTVMSINVGDDIGLEVHPTTDQFIRIEEGQGIVQMGDSKDKLDFQAFATVDSAIMVPAGKWHNVTNTGTRPMKVSVVYAPPEHPHSTVHATKAIAQEMQD